MISNLNTFLTYCDFISERPHLLIDKSDRSKTVYGGIFSFFSVLLISVASIKFALDLFNKETKTMTYNQTPVKNSSYNLGQFPWMIALLDNGLKLIEEEERYYNFYADVWEFYPDNSTGSIVMGLKRTQLKTERCDIDKHFGIYKDYFKEVPYLKHHFCSVPGQNLSLYGIYGSIEPYNFLDFWVSTCVNDSNVNRTNCYPREKSQSRLVNTYISYQSLEHSIDHSNFESPGKLILRAEILPVSSTIYKRDFFYLRNIEYYSDSGLIFSDTTHFTYNQVSQFRETSDLRPQGTVPGSFALITVMMDNKIDEFNRRYSKFQEVLASLGGLFKGICVIGIGINYILFDELYYFKIISGVFHSDFKLEREKKTPFSLPLNKSSFHLINNLANSAVSPNFNQNKLKKEENNINISLINLICSKCLCKNFKASKKYEIYKIAKNYAENQLCIKNIVSRSIEISKLKCFLFNEDQLSIFNFIPTPSFSFILSNTKDIWENIIQKNNLNNNYSNYEAFVNQCISNVKMRVNKTDVDLNFLNMMKYFESSQS